MVSLLAPAGRLICLEFPTTKDPLAAGPPFAVPSDVYVGHLGRPGEQLEYDERGLIRLDGENSVKPGGLERIAHWQAERTHEAGKGKDWVSVWRHVE